ncbi:hypothetical protein CAPTEDRAFT_201550 [Capitella teleta]|uniref:Glycosyltransferase family 92 protein n=1 Tax=Capitella teleta TaxID=283909 RepID=R7U9B5_CAPTE|nr:hypothetical protein CAPTEDRAFT_201550 [Capitella teleta]|eukprot:ELU02736.1 hypothetical protein CAPTEDRAFT_201550 [Capitella teleta]
MAHGIKVFSFLLLFLGISLFAICFPEILYLGTRTSDVTPKAKQTHTAQKEVVDTANPCKSKEVYTTLWDKQSPSEDEPRFQKFGKRGVYSAFYDAREPSHRVLRIIGILATETDVFCHMIATSPAGSTMSVDLPLASLRVLNQNSAKGIKYNFTVCLHKPLFIISLRHVPRILEWIAVNRVFGGEHFVMYTLPSTEAIRKYLQPLVASGLLEIHSWDMEVPANETDENHSQKATINECMYRHMYTSNRLVMIDFDEFPTPHSKDNWQDLINSSPCANESVVYFRNGFFPTQLTAKNSPRSDIFVTALEKTLRCNETFQCPSRSKVIINPRHVLTCSVHYVPKFVRGVTRPKKCCMSEELGYLHHYRLWGGDYTRDPNTEEVVGLISDQRMWHFQSKITESVQDLYKVLNRSLPRI